MEELIVIIGIFVIGIITGFLDSTVGSGGLVSIPMLIFAGLPPQVAIATDRFGIVGGVIGSFLRFWRAKKIVWQYVPLFSIIAIVGGYIGANLLITIPPDNLEKIIGSILLCTLPLLFFKPHLGVTRIAVGIGKKIVGSIIFFILMIYYGFLGTGAGPLVTYNSLQFFGFTILESNATKAIPWFLFSTTSLIIFTQNGIVDFGKGVSLIAGMFVGGYIGTHALLKIGDVWVKRVFIAVVIFFGIKLLLF